MAMNKQSPPLTGVLSPLRSTWVSASAGSGKTKLLVDRLLSLLISNVDPLKILCLTFTNAAALEMQSRIRSRLLLWSQLSPAALEQELAFFEGAACPSLAEVAGLYQRIFLQGPGLRIQTLHGFAQTLLRTFPFEAGLVPEFQVFDEAQSYALWEQGAHWVLRQKRYGDLTQHLAQSFSLGGIEGLLRQGFAQMSKFHRLFEKGTAENVDQRTPSNHVDQALADFLGVTTPLCEPKASEALDDAAFWAEVPYHSMSQVIECLAQGGVSDQKRASVLGQFLRRDTDQQSVTEYADIFLTREGVIRQHLLSKKLQKSHPDIWGILLHEAQRVFAFMDQKASLLLYQQSVRLRQFFEATFYKYRAAKAEQGGIDYDDLLRYAHYLLNDAASTEWIQYKMDGGISHLLVDEAQDTNPLQWQIIQVLTAGFWERAFGGAHDARSLFVVGDPKQSIYSFQGADLSCFVATEATIRSTMEGHQHVLGLHALTTSYRSLPTILNFVDAVFAKPELAHAVGHGVTSTPLVHHAFRAESGGRVTVWPLIGRPPRKTQDPWGGGSAQEGGVQSPQKQMAVFLAQEIKSWLDEGRYIPSMGRAILPSDIMILVRKRSPFVAHMVAALKRSGIPVAGLDRLVLQEEVSVKDLVSLGHWLLLPSDDLRLASLLKSPLFGWGDEALYDLAHNRGTVSLWRMLQQQGPENSLATQTYVKLRQWREMAAKETPARVYAQVLFTDHGREKFVSRLGSECLEGIDAFMATCQSYERTHVPCLAMFLAWFEQQDLTLKRNLDQPHDPMVRILTVHGSKGLQAPIVILPDTTQIPNGRDQLLLTEDTLIWRSAHLKMPVALEALLEMEHEKELAEYYRLLYVALTRAQDEIFIGGWATGEAPNPKSWYAHLHETIQADGIPVEMSQFPWEWQGQGFEQKEVEEVPPFVQPSREGAQAMPDTHDQPLPRWITTSANPEKQPFFLTPSSQDVSYQGGSNANHDTVNDPEFAAWRGQIIHKLLEQLPAVARDRREAVARAFLIDMGCPKEAEMGILSEVLGVLNDPKLSAFFTPSSYAEVAVQGSVNGQNVRGYIDRLMIDNVTQTIHIIDYKTGLRTGVANGAYHRQLELYGVLMREAYPGWCVKKCLVWTAELKVEYV